MPAGQGVQAPAPAREYCPAVQADWVADVLPAGQAYPAVQAPTQVDAVCPPRLPYLPAAHCPLQAAVGSPAALPKVPAGHSPLHEELVRPVVLPYDPLGQLEQELAPPVLNWPAAQAAEVALVDPATQK